MKGREGHHIIQDAAVRNLPGYSKRNAPTVSLSKPSHLKTRAVQRQKGGGDICSRTKNWL
ncbi:TPA: hypothetical protein QCY19_003767 [Bacillus luti]|nr:hypothetical protein [Bacillus luti]